MLRDLKRMNVGDLALESDVALSLRTILHAPGRIRGTFCRRVTSVSTVRFECQWMLARGRATTHLSLRSGFCR